VIASLALVMAFTVPVRPAQPTVGALITVDFSRVGKTVFLDPLPAEVELVSKNGSTVTLRAFDAGKFVLSGVVNRDRDAIRFRNLPVEVKSVLAAADDLRPAPFAPPKPLVQSQVPWIVVSVAALFAIVAWWWLLTRKHGLSQNARVAEQELLVLLRAWPVGRLDDPFLARLSDATRRYLASRDTRVAESMTTREILSNLTDERAAAALRDILQLGDRAKFAPWGAGQVDASVLRQEATVVADERTSA